MLLQPRAGEFDESLILDLEPWVSFARPLCLLWKRRSDDETMNQFLEDHDRQHISRKVLCTGAKRLAQARVHSTDTCKAATLTWTRCVRAPRLEVDAHELRRVHVALRRPRPHLVAAHVREQERRRIRAAAEERGVDAIKSA